MKKTTKWGLARALAIGGKHTLANGGKVGIRAIRALWGKKGLEGHARSPFIKRLITLRAITQQQIKIIRIWKVHNVANFDDYMSLEFKVYCSKIEDVVVIRVFAPVLKPSDFEVFWRFRYDGPNGFKVVKLGIIGTPYLTFPQNFGFLAHFLAEAALLTHIYI